MDTSQRTDRHARVKMGQKNKWTSLLPSRERWQIFDANKKNRSVNEGETGKRSVLRACIHDRLLPLSKDSKAFYVHVCSIYLQISSTTTSSPPPQRREDEQNFFQRYHFFFSLDPTTHRKKKRQQKRLKWLWVVIVCVCVVGDDDGWIQILLPKWSYHYLHAHTKNTSGV